MHQANASFFLLAARVNIIARLLFLTSGDKLSIQLLRVLLHHREAGFFVSQGPQEIFCFRFEKPEAFSTNNYHPSFLSSPLEFEILLSIHPK